jgi:nitrite reductase/ring-hydroxylating ferredoxin subunit
LLAAPPQPTTALGTLSELRQNGRLVGQVGDVEVIVVEARSQLVAFESRCPHQGRSLEDAPVVGGAVECPLHRWKYDLKTGGVSRCWWNPTVAHQSRARLRKFVAEALDDVVYVQVVSTRADAA